jgi:hypothetical protein
MTPFPDKRIRKAFEPEFKPRAKVIHVIGGGTVTLKPGQITMDLPAKRLRRMRHFWPTGYKTFPPVCGN